MRIRPRRSKTHKVIAVIHVVGFVVLNLIWVAKDFPKTYLPFLIFYSLSGFVYFTLLSRWQNVHRILVVGRQHNVQIKPDHEVLACTSLDEALTGYHSFGPEVVFISLVFTLTQTKNEIVALFRGKAPVYFYDPEYHLGCFDYFPPEI